MHKHKAVYVLQHRQLEAFAMNNARTRLIILLLGAPEVLERAEGRQDGTTDPD